MDRYTKAVLTVIAGCLLVVVGNQIDFPPKAYAADGDDRMLEVANGGHAYYFDGNSLHVCVGVQGCTKIRGTKETPRTPEGIRSVLGQQESDVFLTSTMRDA